MYKKSSSIPSITCKSLEIYFSKLPMFLKYISGPVFLQILGGVIIGLGMFLLVGNNVFPAIILMILGIILLARAIWRYLIKMGGLVLISNHIIENEPLKELKYYTRAFENRSGYVKYLLITGLLIPLVPIIIAILGGVLGGMNDDKGVLIMSFIVSIGILAVMCPFLLVTLQSFALNPNLTPWEAIVKGMKLSGGKYVQSWGILLLYTILATIVVTLVMIMARMVCVALSLPVQVVDIIVQIFSQLFIPYWALCFTWWYLRLEKEDRVYNGR